MDEVSVTTACAFEGGDNVIGDVGFGFDREARLFDVVIEFWGIGDGAKIGVEEMSILAKNAMRGLEEFILPRIAM